VPGEPTTDPSDEHRDSATAPADRVALLRSPADGRREYASGLSENESNPALREQRLVLPAEADAYDMAARITEGDGGPPYSRLPSWR
jgi:hypothetical protein